MKAATNDDAPARTLRDLADRLGRMIEILPDMAFVYRDGRISPPHSPTPIPVLTVPGAAGAKAVESKCIAVGNYQRIPQKIASAADARANSEQLEY